VRDCVRLFVQRLRADVVDLFPCADIALLSSWYATRVDMTRRQCVAKGVPFELEVHQPCAAPALPLTRRR